MPTADLPPTPPAIERVVLHNVRAVFDCAALRYSDFTPGSANQWVIVQIDPARDSGAATVPGATLQDGKVNVPPGAQAVVQKKGQWKRQFAHGADWPAEGAYAWNESLDKPARTLQPEDVYSPFAHGGVILFRPVPKAEGLAQFGEVHLLFREWAPLLPLVFSYEQQQGTAPGALPDAEALQRMATLENPMLSLLGFRELAAQQQLSAALLTTFLNRSRGPLRASFTYVLLLHPQPTLEGSGLDAMIERAATPDTLLPVAVGAYAVIQFHGTNTAAVARAKAIILRVRQRAGQVAPPFDGDDTLVCVLRLAGLIP